MIVLSSSVRKSLLLAVVVVVAAADADRTTTTTSTGKTTAYSLDNYCRTTQQLIADELRVVNSNVNAPEAKIQHFSSLDEFVKSDAEPYESYWPSYSCFGNKQPKNLTLVVPQLSGTNPGIIDDNKDNPDYDDNVAQTVMCKMKSADALEKYYSSKILGDDSTSTELFSCSTINKNIINAVLEELKEDDSSFTIPFDKIVFDDWKTITGAQWSGDSPSVTAYISNESLTDGEGDVELHLVAKSIYVSVYNWWFPLRHKVGTQYCQTITYEYALNILIKEVVPTFCTSSPPQYEHFYEKTKWNCPMKKTTETTGTEL